MAPDRVPDLMCLPIVHLAGGRSCTEDTLVRAMTDSHGVIIGGGILSAAIQAPNQHLEASGYGL